MLGLNRGASVHVVQFTSALSSLRTLQVNEKDSISLGASESELVRYVEWRLGDWLILVPSFWVVGVGVPVVGCWLWGHKWGLVQIAATRTTAGRRIMCNLQSRAG